MNMEYKSIFDFISREKKFKNIHSLCIQFEKNIINECYNAALMASRAISELLIIMIASSDNELRNNSLVKKDKEWHIKEGFNLNALIKRSYEKKLISFNIKEKYFYIKKYGNLNSHAITINNFGLENCKEIHHDLFDILLDCYNNFYFEDIDYYYNLDDLNFNARLNSDEVINYLNNIHENEINRDEFIDYINYKNLFLSKNYFKELLFKYDSNLVTDELNADLEKIKWIDDNNIQGILNNLNFHTKKETLQFLIKISQDNISNIISIIKNQPEYLTIVDIDSLLENSDEKEKIYYHHIKLLCENFFSEKLDIIVNELKNIIVTENDEEKHGTINKLENYEIIQDDYGFTIKQVDENIFLDEDQKKAVNYKGKKPLIINAGPGSGKTRVITERVKFLIENEKEDPSSILIITFTNEATNELKNRLKYQSGLKTNVVNRIRISTIHAFCRFLIAKYEDVPYNYLNRVGERSLFIQKHLKELGFKGYYSLLGSDIKSIQDKYDHYFSFGIKTEEFANYIRNKNKITREYINYIEDFAKKTDGKFPQFNQLKNNNLVNAHYYAKYLKIIESYPLYRKLLEDNKSCDDNYLLVKGYEILSNFDIAYNNILIDEFQDTDYHLKRIIDKLKEKSKTFTIVGDLDQSIYGFRGAIPQYFENFLKDKENNEIIELHTNYRSSRDIIEFNEEYIKDKRDIKKELKAKKQYFSPVYHLKSRYESNEFNKLIYIIKSLKDDNKIKYYSDILVLFKSHEKINKFTKYLENEDIPYYIDNKKDFLEQNEIKAILTLYWFLLDYDELKLPYNAKKNDEGNRFLNLYGFTDKIYDSSDFFKLSEDTKNILNKIQKDYEINIVNQADDLYNEIYGSISFFTYDEVFDQNIDFIRKVLNKVEMINLTDLDKNGLIKLGLTNESDIDFFLKLRNLKLQMKDENVHNRPTTLELFKEFITITNFYSEISLKNTEDSLRINKDISLLSNIIKNFESIRGNRNYYGLFNYLNGVLSSYNSSSNELEEEMDKVHVRTIHNAKGLEYPIVIIGSLTADYKQSFPSILTYSKWDKTIDHYPFQTPVQFLERKPNDFYSFHNSEEYRKIYVGMTRAKEILILSTIGTVPDFISNIKWTNVNFEELSPHNISKFRKVQSSKIFNKSDLIQSLRFEKIVKDYLFCPFRYNLCNNISLELDVADDNYMEMVAHNLLENIHSQDNLSKENVIYKIESCLDHHNISSNKKSLQIIRNIINYWDKYGSNYDIVKNSIPVAISLDNCEVYGNIDLIIKEKDAAISIVQFIGSDRRIDSDYLNIYEILYHYYPHILKEYEEFKDCDINNIIIHSLENNKNYTFSYNQNYEKQALELLNSITSDIIAVNFDKSKENCNKCEFNAQFCKN